MESIPGLPARRTALRLLDAALRRGETLDQALPAAAHGLAPPDRALALALAAEAIRWLTDLDALIDSATARPLPADAKARGVLRLMLAGWLRLKTPPHVVIATGLPLLAATGQTGPRRLAHGVFATLVRRGAALPPTPALPAAVVARWGVRAAAIAAALGTLPPLDLSLRDPATTSAWAARLGGVSLAPGHVRLPRGAAIESLPGYAEGAWWVQDFAASLLGRGQGRRALDLCAAPGGKTMQLAAAGWRVAALDNAPRRIEMQRGNLARTGLEADLIIADARAWQPALPFDAILLDAPCTATGTCRRHPEVLHRIGAPQSAEMAALQRQLLARAAQWLAPGGRLIYAVCSLEAEEGEEVAQGFGLLVPEPIGADELPEGLAPTAAGWLRTTPAMLAEAGGLDGFFAARFRAPGP